MTPEYREMPGLPGRFFTCDRYRATLSQTACAVRFGKAKAEARATGELYLCLGCQIGARHAGVDIGPPQVLGHKTCVRCFKQARRILRGSICVSCYNREREVERGFNAKGNPVEAVSVFRGDDRAAKGIKVFLMPVRYQSSQQIVVRSATSVECVLSAFRQWHGVGERPGVVWMQRHIPDVPKSLFGVS